MITILGAGLSGLGAAYHLKDEYIILEKEAEVGGLCRSVNINGYVFDIAPHILFTKDEYVDQLIHRLLEGNLLTHDRKAYILVEGTYVKYPFEANLYPLPQSIIEECIKGVIDRPSYKPHNFLEWILTTFGEGIAKHYMVPYNKKIWKYDLSKINMEWVAGRVPAPSVDDMRKGAKREMEKDFGPNAQFLYPKHFGISALPNKIAESVNLSVNSEVVEIELTDRGVKTTYRRGCGQKETYSKMVFSSIPLPELVKMLKDVPTDVDRAAKSLIYNSLICVDVGVKRTNIIDKHWLYFPDEEVIFNRISFPMNLSPFTTPKGRSSILVEVTYRGKSPSVGEVKTKVIEDLCGTDIIKNEDKVELVETSNFKYAYVIYDLNHRKNVETIHRYLRENSIMPIGRFGEWEYFNMDKALLSGKQAADKFNEGLL
jgi:protoporphyrinogen oxidase